MAEVGGLDRLILGGVDHYRVMEPMFEGIRVILDSRGDSYSPAYIQGISGAAFRMAGICPCAPTCDCAMDPRDLVRLLGYEAEYLPLHGAGIDAQRDVHGLIARVKEEIREGHPALVWHAFTYAEWDVVCGYDDAQELFYGRGSYCGRDSYASAPQTRTATCGDIAPQLGAILIGERDGEFEPVDAELAALREAVRHAHSRSNEDKLGGDKWVMLEGLLCYDRWCKEFGDEPLRVAGLGDRYCLGVYRSTHRAAADFLTEIAARYPAATEQLLRAASHFSGEADALHEAADLLFPDWRLPTEASREVNAKVAALLANACERYARGIEQIDAALRAIEA